MSPRLRHYAELLVGLAILAGIWWYFTPPPAPVGEWKPVKQDPRIRNVGNTTVAPRDCKVVVFKAAAKDRLDLPAPIKADASRQVIASTIVQSDERPQSVTSIFNETTGQTETLTQRMSYPMLRLEQRGQLWVGYGTKNNGVRVGRVLVREDVVQVMALHAGLTASIDSDGQYFAGAGIAY